MSQVYCIRRRRKGKHLNYEDREELEAIIKQNQLAKKKDKLSQRKIAERLGVSAATINRELKRGKYIRRDSEFRDIVGYSADISQDIHDQKATAKGRKIKIGRNFELVEKIEDYIGVKKYSPYAAIEKLKNDETYLKTPICERTLYNYIEKELFLNITKVDLPRKGKTSKRKYMRTKRRIRDIDAKRIDQRPKKADKREELGHWEMDCIESGRGKGTASLLVLVERMSRETIVFKMRSQSQKEVLSKINHLEKSIGFKRFSNRFKSITVDNGSEFLHWRELEKSCISKGSKPRTQIYYCHPYHSWERGTNEQVNGQIRRFIPKGCGISEYSNKFVKELEEWLNNYPRKILKGKTALEFKKVQMEKVA